MSGAAKPPRFHLCVKLNLIISHVIIAYPLHIVRQSLITCIAHLLRVQLQVASPLRGGPTHTLSLRSATSFAGRFAPGSRRGVPLGRAFRSNEEGPTPLYRKIGVPTLPFIA